MSREDLIALDAMDSPDGVLELVTYRDQDATWVGIAKKDKGLVGAIGLHTGSRGSVVETTASIDRGWGVAFGAVAPGIVRAEVRNDDDEAFAARIVALPEGFDPDYRAVWGLADRCRERCDLIAFDAEGRPYDQSDPRVLGPPALRCRPDRGDSRARRHLHEVLRRRLCARERGEPPAPRELHGHHGESPRAPRRRRAGRSQHAGSTGEDHPAVHRTGQDGSVGAGSVQLLWEAARGRVVRGPDFRTFVRSSAEVKATTEAWFACETCLTLVGADDRDELARRGAERHRPNPNESAIQIERSPQDEDFWSRRRTNPR